MKSKNTSEILTILSTKSKLYVFCLFEIIIWFDNGNFRERRYILENIVSRIALCNDWNFKSDSPWYLYACIQLINTLIEVIVFSKIIIAKGCRQSKFGLLSKLKLEIAIIKLLRSVLVKLRLGKWLALQRLVSTTRSYILKKNLHLPAVGVIKYVWPFSGHQVLKG